MSKNQRVTKDISDFGCTVLNHFSNDNVTMKALDIVNTYAAKENSSAEEIERLLTLIESYHDKRITQKYEQLTIIKSYCEKLGLSHIIEVVAKLMLVKFSDPVTDNQGGQNPGKNEGTKPTYKADTTSSEV